MPTADKDGEISIKFTDSPGGIRGRNQLQWVKGEAVARTQQRNTTFSKCLAVKRGGEGGMMAGLCGWREGVR